SSLTVALDSMKSASEGCRIWSRTDFFLMIRLPPPVTLFPYTTLFRSGAGGAGSSGLAGSSLGKTSSSDLPSSRARNSSFSSEERSEEHTSELQSRENLVCRLLLEKKKGPRSCCKASTW